MTAERPGLFEAERQGVVAVGEQGRAETDLAEERPVAGRALQRRGEGEEGADVLPQRFAGREFPIVYDARGHRFLL